MEQAAYLSARDTAARWETEDEFELNDILQFTAATVVDIGVTAIDSLSLGAFDLETKDVLSSLGAGMGLGEYYERHKEGVELASFVGGLVMPGMAAAKALKLARNTRTPFRALETNKLKFKAEAIELTKTAGEVNDKARAALKSARLWTLGEGVAEGMLYEASFMLFMNKHAYMDNNYSAEDAAIGVALGSLVGPLRLIGMNRDIKAAKQFNQSEQLEHAEQPISFSSLQGGDKLMVQGHKFQQIQAVDETAGLSTQLQGIQKDGAREKQLLHIVRQVTEMATEPFKALSKGIQAKTGGTKLIGQFDSTDPYALVDPTDIIVNNVVANPKGFQGATGFGILDPDNIPEALVTAVHTMEDGTRVVNSATAARELLFYSQSAKKVTASVKELRAQTPEGLTLLETADKIVVQSIKKLGSKEKQWISDYLGLPHAGHKEVQLKGPMGKFVVNNKALASESTMANLMLFAEKTTPYAKAVRDINISAPGAAMHPNAVGHFLGIGEAASAQLWNQNPTITLKSKGRVEKLGKYDPLVTSSSHTDARFLDTLYAVNKHGIKEGAEFAAGDIPILQAAIANESKRGWKHFKVGGITLNSAKEAGEMLRTLKEEQLLKGLDEGFSQLQLSVSLNIPMATIDEFIVNGRKLLPESSASLSNYTDMTKLENYANAKVIHVTGKGEIRGAIDEVNISARLDESVGEMLHKENTNIILSSTQSGGGELTQMLSGIFHSPMMDELSSNLHKALTIFDSKNVVFSSADHALRSLGGLGDHITTMSRDFNHLVNKHIERYKVGLTGSSAAVAAHPASATQFARLRQAVHGRSIEEARNFVFDYERGVIVTKVGDRAEGIAEELLKYQGGDDVIHMTPQVKSFMQAYMPIMQESLDLHNAARRMNGMNKAQGAGVWFPYDPIDKEFIGYKISHKNHQDVELITANSAADLEAQINNLQKEFGTGPDAAYRIVTRDSAGETWNQLNRYAELEDLRVADISKKKTGLVSGAAVPGDYEIKRFMQSMTNDTWMKYRRIFRAANSTVFDQLDFMAGQAASAQKSSKGLLFQKVQKKVSNPELISSTLLGKSMMTNTPIMDMANNMTGVMINSAIHTVGGAWDTLKAATKGKLLGAKAEDAFVQHAKELAEAGVPNPYKDASEYMIARAKGNNLDVAQHKIAAAQSILVTANLRFLEAAHAMVTVSSIPVIMAGELAHNKMPMKNMIDAVRFMTSGADEAKSVMKYGADMGHTTRVTSEVSELMADLHTEAGFIEKHKKTIDKLSIASDSAEQFARSYSYALGYIVAKQKWPTASRDLLLSHAAAFTNRTMGNYASKQKPTLFQGAFGSMVGLYQTFMLTMGQNIFRYAEAGDKKAIMALMGSQSGMFGMEALPFFQDFNQIMGEYASDDHNDVRTTAYKVFGDSSEKSVARAEFLLFGLPSTIMGSGFYTRGQLAPRGPFNFSQEGGFSFKPALLDATIQANNVAWETAANMKTSVATGGSIGDMGEAALQGLAMQSLWRPGARAAELMMGKSFDQKGELISNNSEVYEPSAIFSRVMATRPLKEQAMRNLKYQSSYYEGVDKDKRAQVIRQVRRLASDGGEIENIDQLHLKYMEQGGSMNGWVGIMKRAYQASGSDYSNRLAEYAKKSPAIVEIAEMYGQ